MSPRARRQHLHPALALVLPISLLAGPLAGCSGSSDSEAYVVTDLGTSSPAPRTPAPTRAKRATPRPTSTPARTTTSSEPGDSAAKPPTKGAVIARIGAAVAALSAVHVELGAQAASPGVLIDLNYGSGALGIRFPATGSGSSEVQIRRISGRIYFDLGQGAGWDRVAPDDPRLVQSPEGILAEVLAFNLLDDLRTTLVEGSDFAVVGRGELDGVTVDLYRVRLDVSALRQPSLILQADTTGTVVVGIAVDRDGRPVRIDYGAAPGPVSTVLFSDWGLPVSVPVPPVS